MRTFGTLLLSLATAALFAQGPETIPFPDHLKSFAQAAKEELSPEVVNGNKGVHLMLDKRYLTQGAR